VSLAGQAQADLDRTLAAIQDPHSPSYHRYLTPDGFARRFGATAGVQTLVASTLHAAGLSVAPATAGSRLLHGGGTVGQVEALFGVRLDEYRDRDGHVYFAPASAPHMPIALQGKVTGILGLDNRPLVARGARHYRPIAQSHGEPVPPPPPQALGPRQLAIAYDVASLQQAGLTGSGQTMALAETDTFKQSDIDAYDRACGLDSPCQGVQAPPVAVVPVDGGASPAQVVSETTLDIEVVHALAPQTHLIAYEGPSDLNGLTDTFAKIVDDNRAQVLSISLGACEPTIVESPDLGTSYLDTLSRIFQQAAAQGMTVLVAAGDSGAYACMQSDPSQTGPSVSLPASDPWVIAVGGTALLVKGNGTYASESGWEGPLEGVGGGGGVSVAYPLPTWQTGNGVSNTYSTGMRQVPDVAAVADPMTPYKIYDSTLGCTGSACWTGVGGTSAATPLWASLIVMANQQAGQSGKKTIGFITPTLYQMGRGELGASPFHDITTGGDLYYRAGPGWDYSTGWGTPDAAQVIKQLVDQAATR
jgi:kumamolisin